LTAVAAAEAPPVATRIGTTGTQTETALLTRGEPMYYDVIIHQLLNTTADDVEHEQRRRRQQARKPRRRSFRR
jgi:hypothetical protein